MQACLSNSNHDVNPKVMQKLNVKAPPSNLCEAYLEEIAKSYDVPFTPDPNLLNSHPQLIDLGEPPELPSYNLLHHDVLTPTPVGPGGAPYPTDDSSKCDPSLPSLPPSDPNFNSISIPSI